jgi:hypothetical protein
MRYLLLSMYDREMIMSRIIKTVLFASGMLFMSGAAFAQTQNDRTTSISRDSPAAKALAEPAVKTREDMEKAQPLDWNKTIGTPKRVEPTAEELRALAEAKPTMVEGGAPTVQDDGLDGGQDDQLRDPAADNTSPPARK